MILRQRVINSCEFCSDSHQNPEYYKVVKNPMSMDKVAKKLAWHMYDYVEQFVHDLRLIWRNNRLFYPVSGNNI